MAHASPTHQLIPQHIIEKAIQLHKIFYTELKIRSPKARASGMIFFNKYYQKNERQKPKEYALFAIASLHLATKVCEVPVSLNQFVILIENDSNDQLSDLLNTLDGILPKVQRTSAFLVDTINQLVKREMLLINVLNFDFSVVLPYDTSVLYIDKILRWHLPVNSENFQPLRLELLETCWKFLNDLQYTSMFYIHPVEALAIAAVILTFERFLIPLESPKDGPWYTYLTQSVSTDEVDQLVTDIREYFLNVWRSKRIDITQQTRTHVNIEQMRTWIIYPLIKRNATPICPPPGFKLLDSLVKDDDTFKKMHSDHIPPIPPPDSGVTKNFQKLKEEIQILKSKRAKPQAKAKSNSRQSSNSKQTRSGPPDKKGINSVKKPSRSDSRKDDKRTRSVGHEERFSDYRRNDSQRYDYDYDYGSPVYRSQLDRFKNEDAPRRKLERPSDKSKHRPDTRSDTLDKKSRDPPRNERRSPPARSRSSMPRSPPPSRSRSPPSRTRSPPSRTQRTPPSRSRSPPRSPPRSLKSRSPPRSPPRSLKSRSPPRQMKSRSPPRSPSFDGKPRFTDSRFSQSRSSEYESRYSRDSPRFSRDSEFRRVHESDRPRETPRQRESDRTRDSMRSRDFDRAHDSDRYRSQEGRESRYSESRGYRKSVSRSDDYYSPPPRKSNY